MRYYVIAGERSGDLHASNLVRALLRLHPASRFRGFGGDEMRRAGVELVMHYDQLAFMGFEAVLNFYKIARYLAACKRDILAHAPDALILVDYGGFNRQIADFGKKNSIPVFYYIPPKVWAWRQSRAWQLKRTVSRMFVILPFEKEFFRKYGMEVDYVGNPVLDAIRAFEPNAAFRIESRIPDGKPVVALLPGSRKMELQRMVPLMAQVAHGRPDAQFVVAAVRNLPMALYGSLQGMPNVTFVYETTYDLLTHADAAIVTSGTATLETALFNVPQVVVYKAGWLEYAIAKRVVKVSFISLVNLIAGKQVVRELIQDHATADGIQQELAELLKDGNYRSEMLLAYGHLHQTLNVGSASENTARLIEAYWNNRVAVTQP
ncbi:MAG: lipid-A-disaccharide synthase [Cyclobacteriaceae bacterium]|jgi:lipid-A-disaccharide synthase|nr:lipid-A-disaccharide synthase [Cyclobacteriaceae bacterium]